MCYFNSLSADLKTLAGRYGKKARKFPLRLPAYVLAAYMNPRCPVITDAPEIACFKWGLVPNWMRRGPGETAAEYAGRARSHSLKTLNARAESVFEKASFRGPIRSMRCIIPSTGYFEYHYGADGIPVPYYIFRKDGGIFSMGGIFDYWTDPDGGVKAGGFSQITTQANALGKEIHNGGKNPGRMPLILDPESEAAWLDPRLPEQEVKSLMRPFPDGDFDAHPVALNFKTMPPDDPAALEKVRYGLFD